MKPLIQLEHIWADYGKRDILQDISLEIFENDFLGIIGPNGGGKTTLLKVLQGLLKPSRGKVSYPAQSTGKPNMGYLPQYTQIDKNFPISVQEVILSGLAHEHSLFRRYGEEDYQRVREVTDLLNLTAVEKQPIGQLSGGQLQRALLGRAMVGHPQVMVLDEPTTYLDPEGEDQLYQILQKVHQECAIVLVSHDRETVRKYANRLIHINGSLQILK